MEQVMSPSAPEPGDFDQLQILLKSINIANRERRLLGALVISAIIAMVVVIYLITTWRTRAIEQVAAEIAGNDAAVMEVSNGVTPVLVGSLASNVEFGDAMRSAVTNATREEIAEINNSRYALEDRMTNLRREISQIGMKIEVQTPGLAEQIEQMRVSSRQASVNLVERLEKSESLLLELANRIDSSERDRVNADKEMSARIFALEAAIKLVDARTVAVRDLTVLAVSSKGSKMLPRCGVVLELRGWEDGALRARVREANTGGKANQARDIELRKDVPAALGTCTGLVLERWARLFGPDVVALRIHPSE